MDFQSGQDVQYFLAGALFVALLVVSIAVTWATCRVVDERDRKE